jgi:hypothetical protein
MCNNHINHIKIIVCKLKKLIIDKMKEYLNSKELIFEDGQLKLIDELTLWEVKYDSNSLTFLDFVKGVVPKNLTELMNNSLHNLTKCHDILIEVMEVMIDKIKEIWVVRCNDMHSLEKALGVDNDLKMEFKGKGKINPHRISSEVLKYNDLGGLKAYMR